MSSIRPLEEFLALIPQQNRHLLGDKLDDGPSLATIAHSITQWRAAAPYFNMDGADVEVIETDNHGLEVQKIGLLRLWRQRRGPDATYQRLAECLHAAMKADSVQVLCELLGAPKGGCSSASPVRSEGTQGHLREFKIQEIMDVLQEVGFSSANWRWLGRRLKDDVDFDAIESDYSKSERRLEAVISIWTSDGDNPSWEALATALAKCTGGGKVVAKKLREKVGLL